MYDFKAEIQGTGSRSWYYFERDILDISNVVLNIGCGHRGIGLRSQTHYVRLHVPLRKAARNR